MKNRRFTEYNNYPYDHIVARALEKEMITQSDHDLIIAYIEDKLSKGIIEDARAQRIATSLTQWRRFVPMPFDRMTGKELLKAVAGMRKGTTRYGKPYEPGTIRQQIKILKTFTKYLIKNGTVKIGRDDLDEIKYPKEVFDSVKSKDLLSMDHIEQLIGAAVSIRDKAIIGLLADTGLRPSDVANLCWRDLDFNQQRVKVTVTTEKTTTPVTCYVILHKSWLEEYRKQRNAAKDDDFVFVDSNNGLPLSYMGVCHMLDRAAEKCGIKFPKRARAKLFRAISITSKQRAGYSSANISRMHFGTPDSKMMRHYSKLVDEDAERESLEKSGAVVVPKEDRIRPETCPKCNWPISPGVKFCPECGEALTEAAMNEKDKWERTGKDYIMNKIKEMEAEIQRLKVGK
jgi:integrase